MDVGLTGKKLTSKHVEYTVGLQLSDDYFIRVESPFTLALADRTLMLSPEGDAASAFEPLGQLVGQTISSSTVDRAGALTVVFERGELLHVEPDPSFEAWTVSGPKGLLIVCSPGGELSIWHAAD
ncbi:MAG: DUF6188 family protein [Mycobacterium sp.]|nr:DUF6188 family protein [Mycobacterium sp.]